MVSVDSLSIFASQSCHKSDMFKQTVYLFVTYHCSCNGCNFEQFFISVSKMHAQFNFRNAGIKKQELLCVAIINCRSIEKKRKQHTLSVFPCVQCCHWKG